MSTIKKYTFYYKGKEIKIVNQYTYLGFTFVVSGKNICWYWKFDQEKKESIVYSTRMVTKSKGKTIGTYTLNL